MDNATVVSLRLAHAGFGGGDPQKILAMPADQVIDMMHYVQFQSDYEATVLELNRPKQ